jgi:hypothetical protein
VSFRAGFAVKNCLLDGFVENGFQVKPSVRHPSRRTLLCQFVEVGLEHDFVDDLHLHIAELRQYVALDIGFAVHSRRLPPRGAFLQREKTFAGEPAERDDFAVVLGLGGAAGLLVDLCLQRLPGLVLAHLRAKAEIDADALPFGLSGVGISNLLAVEADERIPFW